MNKSAKTASEYWETLRKVRSEYQKLIGSSRKLTFKRYSICRNYLCGHIIHGLKLNSAILLALSQLCVFLITNSFWPLSIGILSLLNPTIQIYQETLLQYGNGIVAISLTLLMALAVFVLVALQPYAAKLYHDRKQESDIEAQKAATNYTWMILNYAALPVIIFALEITAQDLDDVSTCFLFALTLPIVCRHCWTLTPRWSQGKWLQVLPFALAILLASAAHFLLLPLATSLTGLPNAMLLLTCQIVILISITFSASWAAAINPRLSIAQPSSPTNKNSPKEPKPRIFARWVMRDSLIIFVEFILILTLLLLLNVLVALSASLALVVCRTLV